MDPRVRELFEGANYVHLATLMPDGAPSSVVVWAGVEGEYITLFTGSPKSRKARNMARDPRVALSVTDTDNPYKGAQVRGRVAATRHGAEALAAMDALSVKYTGEPFPWRTDEGTLYLIEVEWARYAELGFTHRPG